MLGDVTDDDERETRCDDARPCRDEPLLDANYEDAEVRRDDLYQLEQIAMGYPSRERFLTKLTLDPPEATSDRPGSPTKTATESGT